MTNISQAAVAGELAPAMAAEGARAAGQEAGQAVSGLGDGHLHVHAPSAGATATFIHDLRELFKVKVVGLVLVTGWGGFYLGSMQSGISSMQRGLLDTLLGIGLVSAGAGALNQAVERTTDAKMTRTAEPAAGFGAVVAGVGELRPGMGALGRWARFGSCSIRIC
jgi:hypothetical protein